MKSKKNLFKQAGMLAAALAFVVLAVGCKQPNLPDIPDIPSRMTVYLDGSYYGKYAIAYGTPEGADFQIIAGEKGDSNSMEAVKIENGAAYLKVYQNRAGKLGVYKGEDKNVKMVLYLYDKKSDKPGISTPYKTLTIKASFSGGYATVY